jgi:hypothetical protein
MTKKHTLKVLDRAALAKAAGGTTINCAPSAYGDNRMVCGTYGSSSFMNRVEDVRLGIQDFVDHYGTKLFGG